MNYNGKKFRAVDVSGNGEVSSAVVFEYQQHNDILTCNYKGGSIISGHLIGIVDADGIIDMRYHQILKNGEIQTGICLSTPELMDDGRVRLYEKWKWTSGDFSEGSSILEEI